MCTALLAVILWSASDQITMAAKAPVSVSGTVWDTIGTLVGKFQGSPSLKGIAEGLLQFSPLAEGLFVLDISDGVDTLGVPGTYTQDAKGKIACVPDVAPVEEQLLAMVAAALEDQGITPDMYQSLDVAVQKIQTKAKAGSSPKLGEYVKAQFQVKFVAILVDLEGVTSTGKGSFKYTGEGGEAIPG
jgi:hypothetical protein